MNSETLKGIEAVCILKVLKVGDTVESRHIDAMRHLLGPLFEKIGEPQTLLDIRFTGNGEALIVKGAEFGEVQK